MQGDALRPGVEEMPQSRAVVRILKINLEGAVDDALLLRDDCRRLDAL